MAYENNKRRALIRSNTLYWYIRGNFWVVSFHLYANVHIINNSIIKSYATCMYAYGLSGGHTPKQNLLWQDRRGSSQVPDRQQVENWWRKIKKSISSTEAPEVAPSKVFSREKGVLSGSAMVNLPGPERKDQQLFNLETLDEAPVRPQLNLGDIHSHFTPINSDQTNQTKPPLPAAPVSPQLSLTRKPASPSQEPASLPISTLYQIPIVDTLKKKGEFMTASETEIIKPPSPFLDNSRRRPPPIPKDTNVSLLSEEIQKRNLSSITRPQSFIKSPPTSAEQGKAPQKSHFVKDAVSIFERNNPALKHTPLSSENYISVKIPNKVANTRQRSRGPSRTPSDLDLSRQATPTNTEAGDISAQLTSSKTRLSRSDLAWEQQEAASPRDPSSDACSMDSLKPLEPQVKEKKSSRLRGLINATRSKITMDAHQEDRERSNTDPSRGRVRRSTSVKPVKSETSMVDSPAKFADIATSSFRAKRNKRKPRHLELQGVFNVRGFDNFMMY